MSTMPLRHRMRIRVVALVVGGLALASGLATLGRDEPARPVVAVAGTAAAPAPSDLPANGPTKYLVDSNFCQSCHSNPQNYAKQRDRLLCKMNEYPQWNGKDK